MSDKASITKSQSSRERAIVIGGSMAGLLAARVLSDHFREVTLIERDEIASSARPRKAVPQGRHVHVLMHSGIQVIDRLFPDLLASMQQSARIVRSDASQDFRWRHFGVWKARFNSGIEMVFMYRPSFEWKVASRVLAVSNIKVISGRDVTGYAAVASRERVTGVRISSGSGAEEIVDADLIVDASGRGSQTPKWLRELGLPAPPEARVEINIGYASRIFARPKNLTDAPPLFVVPRPPATRAGAIFPIEDNRWMVTLAGWLADYPPETEKEFLEFAATVEVPDLHRYLEHSIPLTPIVTHKFPASVWRRYDKLSQLPKSLVVLGDALCSFNPVYAQGMTVASLESMALDRCLRTLEREADVSEISHRFHRAAARIVANPWDLAVGEDLRYAEAKGDRKLSSNILRWYAGLVHEATSKDERVARQFYSVMSLLEPPASLLSPGIALRTAAHQLAKAK
ncbi:MAG TPA: FAD-dependent oxidoreductase [Blastocatellia bacterium]